MSDAGYYFARFESSGCPQRPMEFRGVGADARERIRRLQELADCRLTTIRGLEKKLAASEAAVIDLRRTTGEAEMKSLHYKSVARQQQDALDVAQALNDSLSSGQLQPDDALTYGHRAALNILEAGAKRLAQSEQQLATAERRAGWGFGLFIAGLLAALALLLWFCR